MSVSLFDANFYRVTNPDLATAGLTTDAQLLSHFQTYGLDEGRRFSPLVDLNFYRASNSDLAGLSNRQAFDHLQNYGVAEGRRFSPWVDLNFYRASNGDLAGFNNEQLFDHLRNYGVKEGRLGSYINAAEPRRLTDVPNEAGGDPFDQLTNANGILYFENRNGLWKSDGTTTELVLKDVAIFGDLTNVNGILYFTGFEPVHGAELWKSDGTAAGTVLVKDITPGVNGTGFAGNSSRAGLANFTNVNGTLYFVADDYPHTGAELWKSDGTDAGTVLVKDIYPDPVPDFTPTYAQFSSTPLDLTDVNGTFYFTAEDGSHGRELWKSNGTDAGTVLVKDIKPGEYSSQDPRESSLLTNVNGTVYFVADDGVHGIRELWKSDGTDAGTVLVKDINPVGPSNPDSLTNVNGTLYFTAYDPVHGNELWKSDGTDAGTVLVKDIYPVKGSSNPDNLTNVNGTLYFTANDPVYGNELWKSDGTDAGTVLVKDIFIESVPDLSPQPNSSMPKNLTNVNGTLYFTADDRLHGRELWRSNGTGAGTVLAKDIFPGQQSSFSSTSSNDFTNVNGALYFTANDGVHGSELWVI